MPYLIDGSNLGGVLGGRPGSRDARRVVQFVLPWARSRGRVLLVFDGAPRAEVADRYGSVEVRWSLARSADDLIRSLVTVRPASWIVVTDDVELRRSCRDLGASVEKASVLSSRLESRGVAKPAVAGTAEKPAASASDVAYWREIFGVERGPGRRPRRGG